MRICILTLGSRGDVQPYVALGVGLQRAGYNVTVVTAEQFGPFVTDHGLDFAPMDPRFLDITNTKAGQSTFEGGNRRELMRLAMPALRQILDDSWSGAQGADAIIYHQKVLAGYHIAEKLGVPTFVAMPIPVQPTRDFTNPIAGRALPGLFNRASFSVNSLGKAPFMGMVNEWRRNTLGLPPRPRFASEERLPDGTPIPVLHAYSPAVVPPPGDWPTHVITTGYWFLDSAEDWEPPAELADFLEAGPPPVYVGFGSMVTTQAEAKSRMVVEALGLSGRRGIIASGWAGLGAAGLPGTVIRIDQAPHEWLFPRMAAVVHHGGAGTTAAGLRAGRPTVVVPFFGDQSFWGGRVFELGAGPEPIPQKRLTAELLAEAITLATTDGGMARRADALGAALRAEDGVGAAVAFIAERLGERVS